MKDIPEVVDWKLQDILLRRCEGDPTIERVHWEIYDENFPSICGSFAAYGRTQTTWYYTQGKFWVLISDGDTYIEPITITKGVDPAAGMEPGEIWVIELDDSCTEVKVIQAFLLCQH